MAKFNGYVLTEKGRELLAKGLAGGKIEFTKMQIGDGTSGADARSMIALVNPKKDLNLLNINASGGQCELTALLSNHELSVGFYIRELGVFARGDDNTEILYAYNVSTNPDFVPPFSANNIVEIEYVDTLIIDRAANVTAIIDPSITYITRQAADALYLEKKRLAEIIGLEFGGNIQDSGQKMTGKFYYDNVTKHYFECIQNNTDTFTSSEKFKALSNKPISDKLDGMFKNNTLKSSDGKGFKTYYKATAVGNTIDVSDSFSSVEFVLLTHWKSYAGIDDSYVISYQKFANGRVFFNSTLFKRGVFTSYNYSENVDNTNSYGSCVALVYGTLKN